MRYIHRTDPNDLTQAQAHLERARELDPELAEPYPWLCYVYVRQGKVEEAFRTGERAVQLQPDSADAHYFLGVAHYGALDTGVVNYQSAFDHLFKASRLAPQWQPAWAILAELALLNGKYDLAQQCANRLRELNQSPAGTRFIGAEMFLGVAALRRGNMTAAEEWNLRSLEFLAGVDHAYRDTMSALSACGMGDVRLRQGDFESALGYFRRAWQTVKEYPRMLGRDRVTVRALAGLAAGYAAKGDTVRARDLLSQSTTLLAAIRAQSVCPAAALSILWYAVAVANLRLREPEAALQALENSVHTGCRDLAWLERDSELESLRSLPAFQALLRRLGDFPQLVLQQSSSTLAAPA
jgi:tetratricopeptide (TPR) repeat protein